MAMEKAPSIVAIVVTYNGLSTIRACLDSLLSNLESKDILVIDNGSRDGTVPLIEESYAGVTLTRLQENHGFGWANNIGLCMARARRADYVFLVNQDVYLEDRTIRELADVAALYPEYGIVSPMHLNGGGNALDRHFAQSVAHIVISDLYTGSPGTIYECPFVNAAAWLVSRKCFETVGGFDPLFFHYGEDLDYARRVKYFRLKTGICPGIRIRHDRGQEQHMLSTYPKARRAYLDALLAFKDINIPFYKASVLVLAQSLHRVTTGVLLGQLKTAGAVVKALLLAVCRLNRIRHSRRKCKRGGAFLTAGDCPGGE